MKYAYRALSIIIFYSTFTVCTNLNTFSITIESEWNNLDTLITEFESSLVLVARFGFSNKSHEHVNLSKLCLHWNGKELNHLMGSLYKKRFDRVFLPIEDYLICDSSWSTTNQTLILEFDKTELLGPTNIFYLVLTIPPHLEKDIKEGSFNLIAHTLPQQFQQIASQQSLSLSFKTPDTATTTIVS